MARKFQTWMVQIVSCRSPPVVPHGRVSSRLRSACHRAISTPLCSQPRAAQIFHRRRAACGLHANNT